MRSQRKGERPAGKRRRQALQLFAAAALLVGYALSLEGDRGPGSKEYPALEWIRAQEQADVGAVEQADVGAVEQELAEREQAEIAAREAEQNPETEEKPMDRQSLRQRFGLAVLVGDSVAEGFLDYEFLEANRGHD